MARFFSLSYSRAPAAKHLGSHFEKLVHESKKVPIEPYYNRALFADTSPLGMYVVTAVCVSV